MPTHRPKTSPERFTIFHILRIVPLRQVEVGTQLSIFVPISGEAEQLGNTFNRS